MTELVADTEWQLYDSSLGSSVSMQHQMTIDDFTVCSPLMFLMRLMCRS